MYSLPTSIKYDAGDIFLKFLKEINLFTKI